MNMIGRQADFYVGVTGTAEPLTAEAPHGPVCPTACDSKHSFAQYVSHRVTGDSERERNRRKQR